MEMAEQVKGSGSDGTGNVQPRDSIGDFDPPRRPKRNIFAMAIAIFASMTSVLLGYDTGVMSGASTLIQDDFHLTDLQVGILVGTINLFSLVGSAMAGKTSDWLGRRLTIVAAGVIFLIGAILMGLAPNYAFLMVGRFVAGLGVGYAFTIAPVYSAEVAPTSARGFLTSFPEVFVNFGVLLGYVSNYGFKRLPATKGWRWMLGISGVPSVILAVGGLLMPESPRWLIMRGRLGEAKQVLIKTSDSKEEAHERLVDIKQAANIPLDCEDDVVEVPKQKSHGDSVWRELLLPRTPAVRHIMICAVGIHFCQQACGIDAAVLYSPRIFEQAGLKSDNQRLLATVAVGFVKTVCVLISTFLLDRIGRRVLLLSSVGGMVVSLTILSSVLTYIGHSDGKNVMWASDLSIAMLLCFVGSFSMGLGPIAWVYSSEIFPLRLRAQGASLAVGMNRVVSGTIGITFISMYKALTIGGAFFLFTGVALVTWVFFYTMYPETRGRSLEETQYLFGHYCRWKSVARQMKNNNNMDGERGEVRN